MKLNLGAASFLTLALFIMPLAAQDAQPAENQPVAPGAVAPKVIEQAVPAEVLALLADTRPASELSPDELRKRIKTARRFAQIPSLPVELRNQLKSLAEASQVELAARKVADDQKAAGDQAATENAAADKAAKAQAAADKAAANKAAQEQAAVDKAAKAQAALDKAAANKAAQDQAAVDKAAKDQAAIDKAAANKAAQEQAAADKSANDQVAADKAAADQVAKEQASAAKAAKLKAAADKAAAAKVAKDQAALDKAAADQAAADQAAADKVAAGQAAADKAVADKAVEDKVAADKAAKAQVAAEKAAADKLLKDQAAADKAAADQVGADQAAALKAAKDQAAAQNAKPAPVAGSKPPVVKVDPAVPVPQPPVAETAPVVPAVEAPPAKLVVKAPPVLKQVPPPPPPPPESKPLPKIAVVAPPPPPVAAPSAADAKALDSNIVDPASEKLALTYLADKSDVSKLSDDDFRQRLDAIRELMTANELSRETERAVRIKLKTEREVLRQRIAEVEAAQQLKNAQKAAANPPPAVPGVTPKAQDQATTNNTTNNTTINTTNVITVLTPPEQVLRDRRPAEKLDVSELQIRIQIFGDAQSNDAYDPSYRDYWRASVDRDRAILRRRLIEERHRREAELAVEAADDSFEISNDYVPSDRPHRDVFAAEIDYREMEDVLVAPPRQFSGNPRQRYKVEEIAVQPKLRNSISRIEIDTIRFGTNEAFIRDEQVGNLDGIAAIIEKIVKKYPNEVFLIEGHTDAPGSDGYNSRLSKLRAESIKEALISYYVIPAKNLRTVGLGERFLKIPTADAEAENRRVSIARITPLLVQR